MLPLAPELAALFSEQEAICERLNDVWRIDCEVLLMRRMLPMPISDGISVHLADQQYS